MANESTAIAKEPISKHDFYFETGLYELLESFELENYDELVSGDVDAYSAKNHTSTTYSISFSWIKKLDTKYIGKYSTEHHIGFGIITLSCKRKDNDVLRFFVYNDEVEKRIMKVGQYPSLADIQFAEIGKKYDKVLPAEDLKNLKKAVGLVSHGAGAGSFVYLRRIFEKLILEAYTNNAKTIGIAEADFKQQRMLDKVKALKAFLPSQLVEMKAIYSVLSKGVHELTEEECLRYFGPIKLSIELVLDQKLEEESKKAKDQKVKQQLQKIQQEITEDDGKNGE